VDKVELHLGNEAAAVKQNSAHCMHHPRNSLFYAQKLSPLAEFTYEVWASCWALIRPRRLPISAGAARRCIWSGSGRSAAAFRYASGASRNNACHLIGFVGANGIAAIDFYSPCSIFLSIIDASEKMSACVYCTLFNFASVALIAGTKMYGAAAR